MSSSENSLYKEIDLLQNCINRMVQNSFSIKGWFLTLFSRLLSFLFANGAIKPCFFVLVVVDFMFWYLDSFFLRLERNYRNVYVWVINEKKEIMSFYMN